MNNKKSVWKPLRWLRSARLGVLGLLAAAGLAAGSPAHALDMMIWNTGMETKLAYGESGGNVMRGQIVRGASGHVVILFSRSDGERGRSLYGNLGTRYEGEIRGGQVLVKLPSGLQPLEQLLAGYKLKLNLEETGGK